MSNSRTGRRPGDPIAAHRFRIELDGIIAGAFRSCSGLRTETEVFEYAEGGDNATTRKLPGPTKTGNIVLRKGMVDSDALWSWREEYLRFSGPRHRRSGSIIVCDDDGEELVRWNFHGAWPVRWEGPELDSRATDVAVEVLELAPERLERK